MEVICESPAAAIDHSGQQEDMNKLFVNSDTEKVHAMSKKYLKAENPIGLRISKKIIEMLGG